MGHGKFVCLAAGALAVMAGFSHTGKASTINVSADTLFATKSDQHVALFVSDGNSTPGMDIGNFSGGDIYAEAGPLSARVSGVELFANQAVFQYSQSEYYNNSPLSLANLDAAEGQAWRDSSLTSSEPVGLEEAVSAQLLSIDIPAGDGPNAGKFVVTLDQFSPPKVSPNVSSTQLDVVTVGADFSQSFGEVANLTGAADAAPPRELARSKAASISAPPTPTMPEPASIGLLGLAACGILSRRRAPHQRLSL